ncbi:MAG: hypothetical protein ACR2GN_10245 [Bacteroidia bacterium]
MKFGSFFLYCLILLFIPFASEAQDTLIFINGKKEVGSNVKVADTQVHYNPVSKPHHVKKVEVYNVFAIRHSNGNETIVYSQDTLVDDLSLEQMRMFVRGQQDARQYFNAIPVTITSAVIGVGSGVAFQFFGLIPPAVFATLVGASSPRMERQPVPQRELLESPEYKMGYEAKARNIKIKRALIYGIGGAIVGYAGLKVVKAND